MQRGALAAPLPRWFCTTKHILRPAIRTKGSPFAASPVSIPVRHRQTESTAKIGYARVSTAEQNLDLQLRALREASCERIFTDTASGAKADRKGLARALAQCASGDLLVVWKLDRLGCSLIDLVALVEELRLQDVGLRVLTGQGALIDTTKADGRMILGIFAVLAEFERELIRERTKAGMAAAKARGVHVGRRAKLSSAQIGQASRWLDQRLKTPEQIAAHYGVHVTTLQRAMRGSGKIRT